MKKHTKEVQKTFYKEALEIINEHCTHTGNELYPYRITTRWGELGVSVHEENEIVFGVYMKFLEPDKVNANEINKTLCSKKNVLNDNISRATSNTKWNILSVLPNWVLGELDERLSSIKWLMVDENFNDVMSA